MYFCYICWLIYKNYLHIDPDIANITDNTEYFSCLQIDLWNCQQTMLNLLTNLLSHYWTLDELYVQIFFRFILVFTYHIKNVLKKHLRGNLTNKHQMFINVHQNLCHTFVRHVSRMYKGGDSGHLPSLLILVSCVFMEAWGGADIGYPTRGPMAPFQSSWWIFSPLQDSSNFKK